MFSNYSFLATRILRGRYGSPFFQKSWFLTHILRDWSDFTYMELLSLCFLFYHQKRAILCEIRRDFKRFLSKKKIFLLNSAVWITSYFSMKTSNNLCFQKMSKYLMKTERMDKPKVSVKRHPLLSGRETQ